jgi:hypothetical protein
MPRLAFRHPSRVYLMTATGPPSGPSRRLHKIRRTDAASRRRRLWRQDYAKRSGGFMRQTDTWGVSRSKYEEYMAHPTRFERVTFAFGGRRSDLLSDGCLLLATVAQSVRLPFLIENQSVTAGTIPRGVDGEKGLMKGPQRQDCFCHTSL